MESDKIIKAGPGGQSAGAAAETKFVKKEAFSAVLDAVTILETARGQAIAIIKDAEERGAHILEEARRKGEEDGLTRYLEAIAAAGQSLEDLYSQAEPELVRLASAVARKIIGEELQSSPETILKIVREALATQSHARQISIKVHPSAAAQIRNNVAHLGLGNSAGVRVVSTETVAPGGCIIESEFGIIDAQLETQLRIIERSLLRAGGPQ